MLKAKILVVGPPKCGKTVLSNFLSDATENIAMEYRPTKGVRIVEFERRNLNVKGRRVNAEVELWDCGSTGNAESCWPIFAKDVNGLLFTFNQELTVGGESTAAQLSAEAASHQKHLEKLYNHFVRQEGMRDSQCLVVNQKIPKRDEDDDEDYDGSSKKKLEVLVPDRMRGIPLIEADLNSDADGLKNEFDEFLSRIFHVMQENRDKEELNIMNQRQ